MHNPRFQTRLIIFFCVIASLRVAIYLSAFPPFNNMDEGNHFDLVIKYYKANFPDTLEPLSGMTLHYMTGCLSTEYAVWPQDPAKRSHPLFKDLTTAQAKKDYKDYKEWWQSQSLLNYESGLGPVYYLIAGLWTNIALNLRLFDENSCMLLYWIRGLNIFFIAILVWVSYLIVLEMFPQKKVLVIGLPLLVSILPQDTFYSIQNDVLSPVCYAITLLTLLPFFKSEPVSYRQALYTGFMLSLTVLVKTSSLPLLPLVLIFVLTKLLRDIRQYGFTQNIKKTYSLFYLSALLPLSLWFARNMFTFGDLTASQSKIEYLHWSYKPVSEWLNTSFFTAEGLYSFYTEIMVSFWRGELVWSSKRLASPMADLFYLASSFLFFAAAIIGLHRVKDPLQKNFNRFNVWSFICLLLFMILLSLLFDFGDCAYPSRQHPYFASGRLLSAALVPFLIVYLSGFEIIFGWIKNEKARLALLGCIAVLITWSEFIVNRVVFESNYNLFAFFN